MSNFHPLPLRQKIIISAIIILSTIPFLFITTNYKFLGLALFAWLLVMIMILTPIITIFELVLENRRDSDEH